MHKKRIFSSFGFTLVELIVVITILAIMTTFLLVTLNAASQLDKAKDAQRKEDLAQIRNALDVYYNDNNCYPSAIPFGSQWVSLSGTTIYMRKVPQDPDCLKTGYCYVYQTDLTSNCPQWSVVYAHLVRPTNAIKSCQTFQVCKRLQTSYNYCVFLGNLDCTYIQNNPLPTPGVPTPTSGASPTPTSGASPTLPPGACSCASAQYNKVLSGPGTYVCKQVIGSSNQWCDSNCTVHCL